MPIGTGAPPRERTPVWDPLVALVVPTAVLCGVYALLATWSTGQTFGGTGDDGYVDFAGNPSSQPPLVVDVQGHPALWVLGVIVAIIVATAVWASRTAGRAARRRAGIGFLLAILFVVAVTVVFTGVQSSLVEQALRGGSIHPPILGNVTVTTHREVEAG